MKKIFYTLLTTSILISAPFAADTQNLDTHMGETAHTRLSDAVTAELEALKAKLTDRNSVIYIDGLHMTLAGNYDPNKFLPNSFGTPAAFAASHGMFETLKALAQMGAQLVTTHDQTSSPLHTAVELFSTDQVAELLALAQAQGFDVNSQDSLGATLLYCALNYENPEATLQMVRWLVENGARTDIAATIDGKSFLPLSHALCLPTLKDRKDIIELLTKGLTPEQIKAEENSALEEGWRAKQQLSSSLSSFEGNIDDEAVEM